ncbi:MAG: hypothetical protein BIFFINMI_02097 [Phycisphaerae bacterium]|nr:hypothetical protein [Phycisphaerae bacterium]
MSPKRVRPAVSPDFLSRPAGRAGPPGGHLHVILFNCPACHSRVRATLADAGQMGACALCGATFTIPDPGVPRAEAAE